MFTTRPLHLFLMPFLLLCSAPHVLAHPETVTICTVVAHNDGVTVILEIPVNDLIRRYALGKPGERIEREPLKVAATKLSAVLLKDLHFHNEDGERLVGEVRSINDSALPDSGVYYRKSPGPRIVYELRFATAAPPTALDIQQLLGTDDYGVIFKLLIRQDGRVGEEKFFLGEHEVQPLRFTWPPTPLDSEMPPVTHPADDENEREVPRPSGSPTDDGASGIRSARLPLAQEFPHEDSGFGGYGTFFKSGIWHILVGWDHLLFILGVTLAVRSFWELVKVVTAFTVAHTCTMALAALGWVQLPDFVVEPIIAASIVYVAVENVWKPNWAQSRMRMCVAFAFGLFHGLGFAGGLHSGGIEGWPLVGALANFALGVEVGHQVVVLPTFGLIWFARRKGCEVQVSRFAHAASLCLAAGGLYYLTKAVLNSI